MHGDYLHVAHRRRPDAATRLTHHKTDRMNETSPMSAMGMFERFLTLWVALCIIAGIGLGQLTPGVFHALGNATVAQVNLPIAILVWLMIVPMLLKIDLGALAQVGSTGARSQRRPA